MKEASMERCMAGRLLMVLAAATWMEAGCGGGGGGDEDGVEDPAPDRDTAGDEAADPSPDETLPDGAEDTGRDDGTVPDGDDPGPEDVGQEEAGPGTLVGEVELTYYWVSYEGDFICAAPDTTLGTCSGEPIAVVCSDFAESARLEGSAKLVDGRMINIGGCSCAGGFDCFIVLDPASFPWGMGNRSNPLVPFVSVATDVDVIPSGTILYSPEIDGTALPADAGGGVHDGCMRADDIGGGIVGMHIDFFAALREWYVEIDPQVPETITLYRDPPRCSF